METETSVIARVVEFLKQHGYPEETIILEWRIAENKIVDMAVLDPLSRRPVALFEFKRKRTTPSENMAIRQLKNYAETLQDPSIPLYLGFGSPIEPFYELFYLSSEDGKEKLSKVEYFPSFTNFQNSSISKLLIHNEKEKNDTLDWFKWVCWLLASAVIGLFILDELGIIKITSERLGLLAIIIGLTAVPFARKLKILGVEFERLQSVEKK